MSVPNIQISSLTRIQRRRTLPVPGQVLVRQGQPVEVKTAIAEAVLEPKHILLDIANSLGISKHKADDLIQRTSGERINKGDLIAGPVGVLQRVVRAPQNGEIVMVGEGQVLIEVKQPAQQIYAGMPGTVVNLIPDRGAVVETIGAVVQGFWGNRHSAYGLIQSKVTSPDDVLSPDQLDMSQRGAILLGGHCDDPQVFQKATEIPLRGLILTSMASSLLPLARKKSFPILVLEGFGRRSLNIMSYNVLTTNKEREVAVNAEPFNPSEGTRPEVVIPLKADEDRLGESPIGEDIAPGKKVRVIRAPHAGRIATVERIFQEPVELPSGIHADVALVSFEKDQQATVPIANMEVIL